MADNTPAKIEDLVAARIRAQFVELIPEETFNNMVKAAIADFTSVRSRNYDGTSPGPTKLEQIILDEIKRRFMEQVRAALNSPEFVDRWGKDGMEPSEFVKRIITDLSPVLVQALFGSVVQSAISHMRNNLTRL